jgi:signal transduction histidine kinase
LLFAQNRDQREFYPEIDSLENLLATHPPASTELADAYYRLSWSYSEFDIDKSKEYAGKCLSTARLIDDWEYTAFSYGMLGIINYYLSQYDSSLVYYNKALEAIERMRDYPKKYTERKVDNELSKTYGNIGNLFNIQGDCHKAIDYYQKALTIFRKYDWIGSQAMVHKNIGEMYMAMSNYEQAKINFLQSDSLAHIRNDSLRIASVKWSLGNLFLYEKEYAKALQNAEIACGYYLSHPEEGLKKAESLNLLATIYLEGYDNGTRAEEYVRQALLLLDGLGSPREEAVSLRIISSLHLKRGQWRQAEQTALRALATDNSEVANTLAIYGILAKAYAQLRKPAQANLYFDKHDELQSSWTSKNYQSSIREMEVKYETEKKDNELERQLNVIARQNTQRRMMVGGIALCGIILILLWYLLLLRTRRNRVLAQLIYTKDKFFSIISHDLKNPAIAQLNALKMLLNNGREWDVDTLVEYYCELVKSAETEVELISNLLDWARIQTGRVAFMPKPFNIAARLRADILIARNMAVKKGIEFQVSVPEEIEVTGDANMLSTVVRNLLTNAVKFTQSGGQVSFSVESAAHSKVIVAISDTGMGMSKEQLRDLSKVDYSSFSQGTANEHGHGLGLIVCKELLDRHGSHLLIESQEGKGSRFWFEL